MITVNGELLSRPVLRSRDVDDSLSGRSFLHVARWIRACVVPAAVFQSVMVGGGYGTGRELVEFFTMHGVGGGLLGLLCAAALFALIIGLTYEFSRSFGVYDYRSFFRALLGRGWVLFELLYLLLFALVLAVITAAASDILEDRFGLAPAVGAALMLGVVGLLTFFGRETVTRSMVFGSIVLVAVFAAYFVVVFHRHGSQIGAAVAAGSIEDGWFPKGVQYVLYNVAVLPALLFSARSLATRAQAFSAGAIAALLAIVPAALFHLSYAMHYPEVTAWPLPTYSIIDGLGHAWLANAYAMVLFLTFTQTGVGVVQGVIERTDAWLAERRRSSLRRTGRALAALAALMSAVGLSSVGVIDLVARGYGALAWGFLIVYLIPLCVWAVMRCLRPQGRSGRAARSGANTPS